jgi:hypothetical protein
MNTQDAHNQVVDLTYTEDTTHLFTCQTDYAIFLDQMHMGPIS